MPKLFMRFTHWLIHLALELTADDVVHIIHLVVHILDLFCGSGGTASHF